MVAKLVLDARQRVEQFERGRASLPERRRPPDHPWPRPQSVPTVVLPPRYHSATPKRWDDGTRKRVVVLTVEHWECGIVAAPEQQIVFFEAKGEFELNTLGRRNVHMNTARGRTFHVVMPQAVLNLLDLFLFHFNFKKFETDLKPIWSISLLRKGWIPCPCHCLVVQQVAWLSTLQTRGFGDVCDTFICMTWPLHMSHSPRG